MAKLSKRRYSNGKEAWVIRYYDGKVQRIHTIGLCDKRTAEKIFNSFISKMAEDASGIVRINDLNLKEMTDIYLKSSKVSKAQRTVEREDLVLRGLLKFTGNRRLSLIKSEDMYSYRNERIGLGISPVTVNIDYRHLKAFFNWAVSNSYLRKSPMDGIKPIRVPEVEKPKFFELNDIITIRKGFENSEYQTLVEFYLLTGSRLREPLILKWENVNFKNMSITIPSNFTKGKKTRIISFQGDHLLSQLVENLSKGSSGFVFENSKGQQWDYRIVSKNISKKLTEIGFPFGTVHVFRHTYISHLLLQGVPIPVVKEIVGHSSIQTTMKYSHLTDNLKNIHANKRPY